MLESLIELVTPWFRDWGLLIVVVATFLESSIVVASIVPGESFLLLAGFFTAPNALTDQAAVLELPEVMIAGFGGAIAGDFVGYLIGRLGGRTITRRFGRFILLPERRLPVLERYFVYYGGRAVLLGRFAPFLRSVRTLVAGIARMPFNRFAPPAILGAAVWVAAISTTGFLLGESWRVADRYLGAGGAFVFILLAIGFFFTWRSVQRRLERELSEKGRGSDDLPSDGDLPDEDGRPEADAG